MDYLPYMTAGVSIAAFVWGIAKYFDTRNREIANSRFLQFRQVFIWFAGRDENGNNLTAVQQAVAAYQLAEFPEYREMSLPIIEHLLQELKNESPPSLFKQALSDVRATLMS